MCFEKDEGRGTEVDTERHVKRRGEGRKKERKDWKGRKEGWERKEGRKKKWGKEGGRKEG